MGEGGKEKSDSHSHEGQGGGLGVRVEQQYQFPSCLHRQIAVDMSVCVTLEGLVRAVRAHPCFALPCRVERGRGPVRLRASAVCTMGRGWRGEAVQGRSGEMQPPGGGRLHQT